MAQGIQPQPEGVPQRKRISNEARTEALRRAQARKQEEVLDLEPEPLDMLRSAPQKAKRCAEALRRAEARKRMEDKGGDAPLAYTGTALPRVAEAPDAMSQCAAAPGSALDSAGRKVGVLEAADPDMGVATAGEPGSMTPREKGAADTTTASFTSDLPDAGTPQMFG